MLIFLNSWVEGGNIISQNNACCVTAVYVRKPSKVTNNVSSVLDVCGNT
jgi:hypothetical protein